MWRPKKLGQTLNEYACEKAVQKARQYNLPFDVPVAHSINKYRKVKGK